MTARICIKHKTIVIPSTMWILSDRELYRLNWHWLGTPSSIKKKSECKWNVRSVRTKPDFLVYVNRFVYLVSRLLLAPQPISICRFRTISMRTSRVRKWIIEYFSNLLLASCFLCCLSSFHTWFHSCPLTSTETVDCTDTRFCVEIDQLV